MLRDAGYALSDTEKLLNSLDFGVPQTRRRVIVLGRLDGEAPSRPVATDGTLTVTDAFEVLPAASDYASLLASDDVMLTERDRELRRRATETYARQLSGLDPIAGDRSRPRVWPLEALTNSRRTVHESKTVKRFNETNPGSVEPKSRLYRLPLDDPSRTLRAGTGADERGARTWV